jgi:hypothetical protein
MYDRGSEYQDFGVMDLDVVVNVSDQCSTSTPFQSMTQFSFDAKISPSGITAT